jgi:hypothetical protein
MEVIKFPYDACRRVHSRKPRKSKNGTPEERAAKAAAAAKSPAATVIEICRPSIATAESSANPVYEAIDRHRAAAAAHLTAINELHRLESIYGGGCANRITEKPCRDENDAFDALVGAVASTREGLVAKLQYLQDINEATSGDGYSTNAKALQSP